MMMSVFPNGPIPAKDQGPKPKAQQQIFYRSAGPCKNDRVVSTQWPRRFPGARGTNGVRMTLSTTGERVLVVEDEPSTRLGLTELVRTWGFTTDSAGDGEEALQRITVFRPSIIISDLVMPRMGGLDLLRSLKDDG